MAKKKTKKKVKKSVKKTAAKRKTKKSGKKSTAKSKDKKQLDPLNQLTKLDKSWIFSDKELFLRARLEEKRHNILAIVEQIETTGEGIDDAGETYNFTVAPDVFQAYRDAFYRERLTVFPVASPELKPEMKFHGRMVGITGYYEITDVDTGYSIIGWGMGVGCNAFWAANSAQTLAMKQFLLISNLAIWRQPKTLKDVISENLVGKDAQGVVEEMNEFFGGKKYAETEKEI